VAAILNLLPLLKTLDIYTDIIAVFKKVYKLGFTRGMKMKKLLSPFLFIG